MPCPAPIQQLWHPGQRARRSPESKLLPAGKVAKHSHSSRRTTSVFVLVEAKIIPQQGPNQVTFLSSGCDNYYNGEVMPCLMRPWLPPFSYSTTEVRSAGQRTHVLVFLCFPQLVVTTLIHRATTGSTRGRGGQQGPGELCSRAQGQASSARFLISLKSHRDTQIHFRIRHLKSNFRIKTTAYPSFAHKTQSQTRPTWLNCAL